MNKVKSYSTTIVLIKNAGQYICLHAYTYYRLIYTFMYKKSIYVHFFPFPDLNISKDQNQKSMKARKCTGFILISTVSPAFHSDVMHPCHEDLSVFMCLMQLFSSSSFLVASPSVSAQTAGECPWRNLYIDQECCKFNGHHNSCKCDLGIPGTANLTIALPHAPLRAKENSLSFSQQRLRV